MKLSVTTAVDRLGLSEAYAGKVRFGIGLLGILATWTLIAILYPLAVASPIDTLIEMYVLLVDETTLLRETLSISLFRILIGFSASLILGVLIGLTMGLSNRNEEYLYVVVLTGMMIPSLSWAMITLVILGLNETAIILAIVLTTTPFITVTLWEGVKDIDRDLFEMADAFHITRRDRYRHVIGPQLSPYIFSAARYGLGLCWKITVIVELLGAGEGVGFQLNRQFGLFNLEGVFAWTMYLVVIMIFIEYGIIRTISKRVFKWREIGDQQWR